MIREDSVWRASRFSHPMDQGRTGAFASWCSCGEDEKLFVIKANGSREVTGRSLFKEYLGNVLAREMGIHTPSPAVIFIETIMAQEINQQNPKTHIIPGYAVGCEHLSNLLPWNDRLMVEDDMRKMAAKLFFFDMLVQNPDRRVTNPNCAIHKKQLVAFDFEMSFSFLEALQIGKREMVDRTIASDHILYSSIKKYKETSTFLEGLAELNKIDTHVIHQSMAGLPEEWGDKTIRERITNHLIEVKQDVKNFEQELWTVLT